MKLLDADYSAVDLATHYSDLKNLDLKAKSISYNSLSRHPELLPGSFVTAKGTEPTHLELKYDAEP
jgi:hypothetical protein